MDIKLIGKRAAETRRKRGLTQREVAENAGVTREFIAVFESGYKLPSTLTMISIAETLGVSLDYLVFGSRDTEARQ